MSVSEPLLGQRMQGVVLIMLNRNTNTSRFLVLLEFFAKLDKCVIWLNLLSRFNHSCFLSLIALDHFMREISIKRRNVKI